MIGILSSILSYANVWIEVCLFFSYIFSLVIKFQIAVLTTMSPIKSFSILHPVLLINVSITPHSEKRDSLFDSRSDSASVVERRTDAAELISPA